MKERRSQVFLAAVIIFSFAQGVFRYSSRQIVVGQNQRFIYREFDARGSTVDMFRKRTEREYFKVKGGFLEQVSLPGLGALDFSLTWLRILASVYDEASVEGDFSWLFHKLRFISQVLPRDEQSFKGALLPFFVVLGKDPAGAMYLLNEKMTKFRSGWRVPYWAGFHALENLNERKLAGSLFLEAAKYPGAPEYLTQLGIRLLHDDQPMNYSILRKYATDNLEPEVVERLRKLRPEWFVPGAGN